MNQIISFDTPDLRSEVKALRLQVAGLLQEKEDLLTHICPSLQRQYMETFGPYIRKIQELDITRRELLYRIWILQAAVNRMQKVSQEDVEASVHREYDHFREQMKQQQKAQEQKEETSRRQERNWKVNEARYQKQQGVPLSGKQEAQAGGQRSAEEELNQRIPGFSAMTFKEKMKALYRFLVKKLHPDMNPNLTQAQKKLWERTQEAYRNGDLTALESVFEELINGIYGEDPDQIPPDEAGIRKLQKMKEKLLAQKAALLAEIQKIRESFPYTEKEMLEDPAKQAAYAEKLKQRIAEYEQILKDLQRKIAKLEKLCKEAET